MILYQLSCESGHCFESWFRDSAAYDKQTENGLLVCPVCRSSHVVKTIMAPAVVGGRGRSSESVSADPGPPAEAAGSGRTRPAPAGVPLLSDRHRALRVAMKGFRDKILSEGRDVGSRFPDQARQMHDGDIPFRPIHGQATPAEARGLIEDGIMILPIPVLPEELN